MLIRSLYLSRSVSHAMAKTWSCFLFEHANSTSGSLKSASHRHHAFTRHCIKQFQLGNLLVHIVFVYDLGTFVHSFTEHYTHKLHAILYSRQKAVRPRLPAPCKVAWWLRKMAAGYNNQQQKGQSVALLARGF
eukprot:5696699-Amphidinium_carterae.1